MDQDAPARMTPMSPRARATAANYVGRVAAGYDADRERQIKWAAEHRIVAELLAGLPAGATVLDVPVGTGRFLELYRLAGLEAIGLDVSGDMLQVARAKVAPGQVVSLRRGNVLALDLADASVDVALCIRLLNMMEPQEMARALHELQRVARARVILSLRVGGEDGRLTRPQTVAGVVAALAPGWCLAQDREIHKPRYRMLVLERSP